MQKTGSWTAMRWKVLCLLLVAVVALTACTGDSSKEEGKEKQEKQEQKEQKEQSKNAGDLIQTLPAVVAEYKGGKLEKAEFAEFLTIMRFLNPNYTQAETDPEYANQMVEAYVSYEYVAQRVDKKLLKTMKQDVAEQVAQLEKDMDSYFKDGGFTKRLQEYKVTKQQISDYLQQRYQLMKYIENQVTAKEIRQAYEKKRSAGEMKKTTATVSHILFGTNEGQPNQRSKEDALAQAKKVLADLKKGADFAAAAKQYSDDPGSKDNGGEYKDANVDDWVPEFKQAAITLPLNQLSEPVETQYGYHIMKVTKRSETTKTFADVEKDLQTELAQALFGKMMEEEVKPLISKSYLQ